jgi:hypothetical protein
MVPSIFAVPIRLMVDEDLRSSERDVGRGRYGPKAAVESIERTLCGRKRHWRYDFTTASSKVRCFRGALGVGSELKC